MIFGQHPHQGLYDPAFEHDACGVAFVAQLSGRASHEIVEQGLEALRNLDHRGATGADEAAGDGAGILVQVPDDFLRRVTDFDLPAAGSYAMGMGFLPLDEAERVAVADAVHRALDTLTKVNRDVVVLRYFVQLSEKQTAEVLGIAPGTVKSRLSRALAHLSANDHLLDLSGGTP